MVNIFFYICREVLLVRVNDAISNKTAVFQHHPVNTYYKYGLVKFKFKPMLDTFLH
jgi:hypothetical protein